MRDGSAQLFLAIMAFLRNESENRWASFRKEVFYARVVTTFRLDSETSLTFYAQCIILQYVYKQTRCTNFCD
jgi:hypothetical protein